ncbi:hypothetical protein P167DRAFT_540409 [Morchella conica CCBAS932]|uniref:Uncharacterized protein n=1 Tax=Morchella conica CCBAS932 TaxID=1392247 RepID=A0A3N4K940_9PEZI|nr:hypothetical protein P167DRAFT_540409 [Morchella conica CCBAS932]
MKEASYYFTNTAKACYNGTFYKGNLSITVALLGPFCLAFSTSTSNIRVISL